MAYITVNFADVESFEPLPEGEYGVEIDSVEVRENKNGDALYLNWTLVVVDGDFENRRLWMITSLKDTALFRLKSVFENLDVLDDEEMEIEYDDDIDPSTKEGPRLLYPEVDGIEATAVVKNEMYEGREQNRVNELYVERKKTRKRSKVSEPAPSRSRRRASEDDEPRSAPRSRRNVRNEDPPRSSRSRRDEEDDDDEEEEEERPRRRVSNSRSSSGPRRRIR